MRKVIVYNLQTGEEIEFLNDLTPEENLVSAAIQSKFGSLQLYNEPLKKRIRDKIMETRIAYAYGDLVILKENPS